MNTRKKTTEGPCILRKLGIYGYERAEWPILCALVTGDPVLLVGGHGSAKTYLAERLAVALGLSFQSYDASKNLFEDVLGFPNPASIKEKGIVEYIPTEISIWGKQFLLVDEISRANPAMQSKWLEIIRNRKVMGKKIEGLSYIFSAMNPPSYLGAFPLDEALAGRFAAVAHAPSAEEMQTDDQLEIMENVTGDDAPHCRDALKRKKGRAVDNVLAVGKELKALLTRARKQMKLIPESASTGVSREGLKAYVMGVSLFCMGSKRKLDGRRLGMLWRNLMAASALYAALNDNTLPEEDQLSWLFLQILRGSLPFMATEEEPPGFEFYQSANAQGMQQLREREMGVPPPPTNNPIEAAWRYRELAHTMNQMQHTLYVRYFNESFNSRKLDLRLRAGVALLLLGRLAISQDLNLHPQARFDLLELIRRATAVKREILEVNNNPISMTSELAEAGTLDPTEQTHRIALRLALGCLTKDDDDNVDFDDDHFPAAFEQVLELLQLQKERGIEECA